ncbi:MAG: AbrB/MazE/SpoVT family DNA-binding domain-containing protein [Myxococcales bacterium]
MEQGFREEPKVYRAKVDSSGRILLPLELRSQHGIGLGDSVILVDEGKGVELKSAADAIRDAQELFRQAAPPERVLSDELLQETSPGSRA